MLTKKLDQEIAIVTGASGGIGRAIALALAINGARLCLVGRDKERLLITAELCRPLSPDIETRLCDLSLQPNIEALCENIAKQYERLDILIHCAGTFAHGSLEAEPIAVLDQQYNANVRGPLLLTQKLLALLKRPKGQIVVINSSSALSCAPGRGQYTATKYAMKAITDTLRQEVNDQNIRITSIFLGRTATRLMESFYKKNDRQYEPDLLLQPEEVASTVIHALTIPWSAEITDISIRPMKRSY
jgi:NADP-dependent 3-hydroxy acid dehydrogenase YdfG